MFPTAGYDWPLAIRAIYFIPPNTIYLKLVYQNATSGWHFENYGTLQQYAILLAIDKYLKIIFIIIAHFFLFVMHLLLYFFIININYLLWINKEDG